MRVPTFRFSWVRDMPTDLVCIVMTAEGRPVVGSTLEYVGTGVTIAEALHKLAASIEHRGADNEDGEIRMYLRDGEGKS